MWRTAEEKARKDFEKYTADHRMEVFHNEGLYRHIRYKNPETIVYYYDLVTWPGHLVVCGDAGTFHFSRVRDMFEFFEHSSGCINPQYWSEKLQGHDSHRNVSTRYSVDAFHDRVKQWRDDWCAERIEDGNWEILETEHDSAIYRIVNEVKKQIDPFRREVEYQLLSFHPMSQGEAYRLLESFSYNDDAGVYRIEDSWEWSFREPDSQFLWCCWAIVRGIEQYRSSVAQTR